MAGKLATFPAVDDALRRGEISYSKVRAIVRVATEANETLLLEYARLMPASDLEKLCKKYALVQRHGQESTPRDDEQRRYVRRRDTEDGMVKIEAVLHPEEAEMVWTMLNDAAKQLARDPGRRSNDSAESPEEPAADVARSPDLVHARSSAETESPGRVSSASVTTAWSPDTCGRDDSAESPEVATTSGTVPVVASGLCAAGTCRLGLDDSADSPEVTTTSGTAAVAASGLCAAGTCRLGLDDSGDSPEEVTTTSVTAANAGSVVAAGGPDRRADGRGTSVLHQWVDATKRAFNRADALMSVAHAYLRGERPERAPIDVTLTIPVDGLRVEAADPVEVGELGEAFVSRAAARRLSCDAGVVEVVEDEHGAALSVGRKRRTISGALKRALCKRDKECTFPGCTHRVFLEGHHIKHWADGGETSLSNALLLCTLHHRYVHEYGYTIELGPDQRPQFRDPRGRLVAAVPATPVVADLGWPRLRGVNEPLAIDAETIACEWDGRPVDYGALVGHLVVADGLV